MVLWITGKGRAGKSQTAKKLLSIIPNSVAIDAGVFRRYFKADFTDNGRREHIVRMAKVAAILERQGFVPIVTCVSPTKEMRQEARSMFKDSVLIHVPGGVLWEGTTYEEPDLEEIKGIVEGDYGL